MPRPKRSKVASSVKPAPRAGPAPKASKATPAAPKTVAEDIEDGSDEGGNITTSVRRVQRTNLKRKAVDTHATSTTVNTTSGLRKGRGRGIQAGEIPGAEDKGNRAQDAQNREASTPSIEMSRREATTTPAETSGETLIPSRGTTLKKKSSVKQSAALKAPGANEVVSSIESDIAVAPITLPRMENTILGQPTFRGRSRQRAPSILGKGAGAARARSSSMGLEMTGGSSAPGTAQSTRFSMVGGTFRRRERQPSLLGSNRKKLMMRQEVEQRDQDMDDEDDADEDLGDFNDFNPDDESTPLNAQKTKSIHASNHSSTAVPVSSSSNSRKRRKISEIQVPRSQTPQRSSPPQVEEDIYGVSPHPAARSRPAGPPQVEEDIYGVSPYPARSRPAEANTIRRPLPAEEDIYGVSSPVRTRLVGSPIIRQTQSRSRSTTPGDIESPEPEEEPPLLRASATPELLSETNAPPRSSSPTTPTFPRTNLARIPPNATRRRQILATQDSPISSPPSLTHSPNYKTTTKPAAKKQNVKKAKPEVPLTTAALQNLLPQRRRRRGRRDRDEFDMPSSGDEEVDVSGLRSDDDELSYLNAPARRGRTRTPGIGRGRAKTPASAKTTTKKSARKVKQNAKVATMSSAVKGTQKSTRTYGSRTANKENNNVDDEDEEDGEVDVEGEGEGDDSLPPDANSTPEDENSHELEERIGKELKQMKRKFEVVDQWEMEFEDVETNSSEDRRMADAR